MASLSRGSDGRFSVQFVGIDSKRRTIRLGKTDKRTAEATRLRVEALLAARIQNVPIDRDTSMWLAGIGSELADRLAGVGLIEARDETTLGAFTEKYIERRTDIKPRTIINLNQCRTRLIEFFGADKPLRSFNAADADAWLLWLKERYANGTTGRAVKRARQFFAAAVRGQLIPSNPFADVKPPSMVNESRKAFVDRPTIDKVLAACPDAEWRLILALARYAGIRVPSELLLLTWADVLWDKGRLYIHSPKTERHEGKEGRFVPIFPELKPCLEQSFELAEPGTVFCINRYRSGNANLRTQLHRICRRAGVVPWGKPFHNMRASRETELAASFPLHVVCEWIGNSATIAQKHYLTVTDADFLKATREVGAAKSDALGAEALHFPVQSVSDARGLDGTQPLGSASLSPLESSQVLSSQDVIAPPAGLEPA